jgi:outer membrane immunogenic protein
MKTFGAALVVLSSLIATPILAADLAVKAPPAPTPTAPSWTGFYIGVEAGYGWNNNSVNLTPNDPVSTALLSGMLGPVGEQPVVSSYKLQPNGAVGGIEAGYNWQAGPNWLWGVETDFSFTGLNGSATGTSELGGLAPVFTQASSVQQNTDWYGTVRGRLGWLATPNLLIFGTGGFAYGRVADLATYGFNGATTGTMFGPIAGGFAAVCFSNNVPCFFGSSTQTQTGWTAGGGAEWRFSQYVSLKAEYQVVDLGTQTVRVTAGNGLGFIPSSFNAAFRDEIQVVRVGLNWHL